MTLPYRRLVSYSQAELEAIRRTVEVEGTLAASKEFGIGNSTIRRWALNMGWKRPSVRRETCDSRGEVSEVQCPCGIWFNPTLTIAGEPALRPRRFHNVRCGQMFKSSQNREMLDLLQKLRTA
jgi:hypothetical protein